MKICSLLPSGTEIVYALGLVDDLVGVTDLCDYPPAARLKPVYCHSLIDTSQSDSVEVERQMQRFMVSGQSPYWLDLDQLHRNPPELVLAQNTCFRCDIDERDVYEVCVELDPVPAVLVLGPRTLSDIFTSINRVAQAAGVADAGNKLVGMLERRVNCVTTGFSNKMYRPTVVSLEGINPLVAGGHWLPELKELAGGRDDLFTPGCDAEKLRWHTIRDYDPQVLVITPCSSNPTRSMKEIEYLAQQEGWWDMQAVRAGEVYVVDHVYFSRPGPRIIQGLEILAQILHPELFDKLIPHGTVFKLEPAPRGGVFPGSLAKLFRKFPG